MSRWQAWFLRCALFWLVATGAFGLYLTLYPARSALLAPTHAHLGTVGFFLSMVMGVAFWMLPRPGGLRQPRAELITLLLLQSGITLRLIGEPWWRSAGEGLPRVITVVGALLVFSAMVSFANAMRRRVVSVAAIRAAARPRTGAPPVVDEERT